MTIPEALKILGIIKLAYPNAWKDIDQKQQAGLWTMLFADEDRRLVEAAVKEYILSDKEFPPSPGQINAAIQARKPKPMSLYPTADEAWRMVLEAARNSGYHAEREFAKLPVVVQRTVGKPLDLKEIGQMDTAKDLPFEGKRFRQRYQAAIDNPELPRLIEEAVRDEYQMLRKADPEDFLPEEQVQALIAKAEGSHLRVVPQPQARRALNGS